MSGLLPPYATGIHLSPCAPAALTRSHADRWHRVLASPCGRQQVTCCHTGTAAEQRGSAVRISSRCSPNQTVPKRRWSESRAQSALNFIFSKSLYPFALEEIHLLCSVPCELPEVSKQHQGMNDTSAVT